MKNARKSLLYQKRTLISRRPGSSFAISGFQSLISEDFDDTTETIPGTPLLDFSSIRNSRNFSEVFVNDFDLNKDINVEKSLVMKSPMKVRTKKRKEMKFEEIVNVFQAECRKSREYAKNDFLINSCIPQLSPKSSFFILGFEGVKNKLINEYQNLIQTKL